MTRRRAATLAAAMPKSFMHIGESATHNPYAGLGPLVPISVHFRCIGCTVWLFESELTSIEQKIQRIRVCTTTSAAPPTPKAK